MVCQVTHKERSRVLDRVRRDADTATEEIARKYYRLLGADKTLV